MRNRYRREPRSRDMLQACFESGKRLVDDQMLPGVEELVEQDPAAQEWILEQQHRIRSAIRDVDEILFERSLASWIKAYERLNELVAEEYREQRPDPETWELRYVRWMKIKFIRFESEKLGMFYLVPKRPNRKPRAEHWYTVEEMLDMLHPSIAGMINTFGTMPARPEPMKGPGAGEKHLTLDFTGEEPVFAYTVPGGPKYDREKFRRLPDRDDSEVSAGDSDQAVGQTDAGSS